MHVKEEGCVRSDVACLERKKKKASWRMMQDCRFSGREELGGRAGGWMMTFLWMFFSFERGVGCGRVFVSGVEGLYYTMERKFGEGV